MAKVDFAWVGYVQEEHDHLIPIGATIVFRTEGVELQTALEAAPKPAIALGGTPSCACCGEEAHGTPANGVEN